MKLHFPAEGYRLRTASDPATAIGRGNGLGMPVRHPEEELLVELQALEALLDAALEDSFPASDPVAISRRERDD